MVFVNTMNLSNFSVSCEKSVRIKRSIMNKKREISIAVFLLIFNIYRDCFIKHSKHLLG